MAAKIRNALVLYRPLRKVEGAEIRFHETVLYNSIYVADDELLVNTHVYGLTAAYAPSGTCGKSPAARSRARTWKASSASGKPPNQYRGSSAMARRIDHYDDPNAPAANSIVPSVNVVVTNDHDEILLIKRSDNDNWALPGGAIDLGESLTEAAIRETKEETGIDCEITGLVGIYTDPKHVIHYTSNDEVHQEFSIVLTARRTGGRPTVSSESNEVQWVERWRVTGYRMDRSMLMRVHHYLGSYGSRTCCDFPKLIGWFGTLHSFPYAADVDRLLTGLHCCRTTLASTATLVSKRSGLPDRWSGLADVHPGGRGGVQLPF